MKFLCIGNIAYDITFLCSEFIKENTRNIIKDTTESCGGSSVNAACLLGKWGSDVYLAGVVGYDAYSEKIKKELLSFKVNADYIETDYESKSALTYILVNNANSSRTILKTENHLPKIKKAEYSITPNMILLDGHEYVASLQVLKSMPNCLSMIDASRVNKEVLDLCNKVNFIVCSTEFAHDVSGITADDTESLAKLYQNLKMRFKKQEIIVTLEEKGVLYSINNQIKILPGLKVSSVDTTGAGDIFHGAFAYQYCKTKDLESAVKFANIAAGLSVRSLGTKQSIPDLMEVEKYYAQV